MKRPEDPRIPSLRERGVRQRIRLARELYQHFRVIGKGTPSSPTILQGFPRCREDQLCAYGQLFSERYPIPNIRSEPYGNNTVMMTEWWGSSEATVYDMPLLL